MRDRLENLQEETRELTPEEQEERIKKEKIKIALEKMKAASVQKLVVKVFDDNLETSKTMLIDQTWTVRDIVTKMVKKNDVEVDPNWSLIEKLPDMYLGTASIFLSFILFHFQILYRVQLKYTPENMIMLQGRISFLRADCFYLLN